MTPTQSELHLASQLTPSRPRPVIHLTRAQCDVFASADRIRIDGEKYCYFASLGALVRADAVAWIEQRRKGN